MAVPKKVEIQRVVYWQGQLLASDDLQSQLRVDEELWRLHNRALHRAYGIAVGLGQASEGEAKLEDGKIKLPCGMAYDCVGRGLIVEEDRIIQLPKQANGGLTLVLSYDPTSADGIALTWKPAADVSRNAGVAILRLKLNGGVPEIDAAFRPAVARPLARPRLATGATIPGGTAWQTWSIDGNDIGVQVSVDTSAAGFTQTPHYFAEATPGAVTSDLIPAWIASIADQKPDTFKLQLLMRRITREPLDMVDPKAQVIDVSKDLTVTLDAGNLIQKADLVARLLPLGERASSIKTLKDGTATLDFPLDEFTETKVVAFGNIPRMAKVVNVFDAEIEVDDPGQFRVGDLVAKIDGAPSSPVRVQGVSTSSKKLTLSQKIPNLEKTNTIVAADFRERATLLELPSQTLIVADATLFSPQTYVAGLDDLLSATLPALVTGSSGRSLTLDQAITGLTQGDVIGLCTFPRIATVQDVQPDGSILVNDGNLLRNADLIMVLPAAAQTQASQLAVVAAINGNLVRLASEVPGLVAGDRLATANIRGVVKVTPIIVNGAVSQDRVKIEQPANAQRVHAGDFLADITGWMQPLKSRTGVAGVTAANGTQITLSSQLDGLLANDTIGLASLIPTRMQVRLNQASSLSAGEEVLMVGLDRRQGQSQSIFAVVQFPPVNNFVLLAPEGNPGAFEFRPEDISASVLFVSGSPMRLIQNLDLFVSWLACADSDALPKPCSGPSVTDDPCLESKESIV